MVTTVYERENCVALVTLENTERTLQKDELWANTYKEQMNDMVHRKVARPLTSLEIQQWKGPIFYISHLAVLNPKSNSTPVRIAFNSSQVYKGVSLNSCLAKGPDCYMNNLIGILLRWREEAVALVGDIRKDVQFSLPERIGKTLSSISLERS
ncbi:Hypothetical predicted protein [Paramuricea clavata]|uniref:Uncharacterized protein n=1 Tax=Paramuricea clavata TaxID=317549 RepID=A0A6S7IU86_PARCT|nr:Hypothetical predicted protein [Paramuricea clavata]